MCGRYVLKSGPGRVREELHVDLDERVEWRPRYNVAPHQAMPVIRAEGGWRRADLLTWGLVPAWAESATIGNRMINARAETAAVLPAFRAAFKARRAVVPADGFYEWRALGVAGPKWPYYIHRRDGHMLAMAGLWERWSPPGVEQVLETFTIITVPPSAWMRQLHDRMPAILGRDAIDAWLDPATSLDRLKAMLAPAPENALDAYAVGRSVGNTRNDGEDLLRQVEVTAAAPPRAT
ncbi:MAG: SOS response-associated peptidase [Burkholderiales bacterium]|nr:SOS response-associated peptidase [Burkholderiales bacterium]